MKIEILSKCKEFSGVSLQCEATRDAYYNSLRNSIKYLQQESNKYLTEHIALVAASVCEATDMKICDSNPEAGDCETESDGEFEEDGR